MRFCNLGRKWSQSKTMVLIITVTEGPGILGFESLTQGTPRTSWKPSLLKAAGEYCVTHPVRPSGLRFTCLKTKTTPSVPCPCVSVGFPEREPEGRAWSGRFIWEVTPGNKREGGRGRGGEQEGKKARGSLCCGHSGSIHQDHPRDLRDLPESSAGGTGGGALTHIFSSRWWAQGHSQPQVGSLMDALHYSSQACYLFDLDLVCDLFKPLFPDLSIGNGTE